MGCLKKGVNDLKTWCIENSQTELLLEWDEEKNGISPDSISRGYDKKAWWKCQQGHSYYSIVKDVVKGHGCPYCAGKTALPGYNDIFTLYPYFAKEWDYEKNEMHPDTVTHGSKKKYWWKCPFGHSYEMRANNRTSQYQSCPVCAKEKSTSFAEQAIYFYVCKYCGTAQNRNRSIIEPYELDIYIPEIKTAIEYDGERFHQNIESDLRKTKLCQEAGIRLFRIREEKCPSIEDGTVQWSYNRHKLSELENIIMLLVLELSGKSVRICLKDDAAQIYALYLNEEKANSLAIKSPQLLKLWDYQKNGRISPEMISNGSKKLVWWKCEYGHSYLQSVVNKTNLNQGCPVCLNRICLTGFNDLESWCINNGKERLLREGSFDESPPSGIMFSSTKRIKWTCEVCNNIWITRICNRTKSNQGCPKCSYVSNGEKNRFPSKGNSIADRFPELLCEWDYNRNERTPEETAAKSNHKAWWICTFGHSYETVVSNRTNKGSGCPVCARNKQNKGDK